MKTNILSKTMRICLVLIGLFFFSDLINAQQRYYDEIFTQVEINSNIQYGANYSVLSGTPTLSNLLMDVYTPPSSDTVTLRPLIIFLHTGSFLPPSVYTRCTGSRTDSTVVELCTRFAKRGYVAAAVSYRLGWDPLSLDHDTRTGSFTNALYRGIQDAKNAVRYFRDNAYNGGNTYGIDQDNIIVGGQGNGGGYIALAYSTLDNPNELLLDKFRNSISNDPYVDTTLSGDYNGLQGSAPLNQINIPNVASNIKMTFNIGGALADSSWLQGGERPMVSFHVPDDPFTPYLFGDVIIPSTGDFLMEVFGSNFVIIKANLLGNQDVWDATTFNDPFTARANSINNGNKGLFPFILSGNQAEPWEWWDVGCPDNDNSLLTNPDMSSAKGRAYIDSIIGYLNPRIISGLQYIPCSAGFNLFPDSIIAHNWFAENTCTGSAPLTYNWHWGDGDSSAGSNPTHIYNAPGYYNICVSITAANGCYDYFCDSSTYIYKTNAEMISVSVTGGLSSGIKEKEKSNLNLYPNPASTHLTIQSPSAIKQQTVKIVNTLGHVVMLRVPDSYRDEGQQSTPDNYRVDISELNPGVYYLFVEDEKGNSYSKKFVVAR